MNKIDIVITTDGACSGNPGPGGYAAIIRCQGHSKRVSGYCPNTTNNRMELTAVIEAVKWLNKYVKQPAELLLRADSTYVINGVHAMEERRYNGWKTKTGASVINMDLWQELDRIGNEGNHSFQTLKVDGHSGDPDNEECDRIAKQRIKEGA